MLGYGYFFFFFPKPKLSDLHKLITAYQSRAEPKSTPVNDIPAAVKSASLTQIYGLFEPFSELNLDLQTGKLRSGSHQSFVLKHKYK
jgi:hypothetical protein